MNDRAVESMGEGRFRALNWSIRIGAGPTQQFDVLAGFDNHKRHGSAVRQRPVLRARVGMGVVLMGMLAGCGAPAPKQFGGSWMPVNRFQAAPAEIPLHPSYIFYASPMDGTVQAMLGRWAADNDLQLAYEATSDFTLHKAAATIRTTDLRAALAHLSEIYAPQGLAAVADGRRIVVQQASGVASTRP
ncbi:hypothetical protein PGB34_18865 [Xenophilus arseniciresistens]|uniref:Toxin co-regulated pilus biosynthesis protein Q C-terminal domain-containing protein n=1 Tax=Xenophilus arseniciresistens TaxID=1283306 RepID=A0AAE3NCS3_9BURK|nr:hypothetical protein [Xenophilus arseniciresistens]MDA7418436.1 hypothetical protein [Xenophilus arseniciresistens]